MSLLKWLPKLFKGVLVQRLYRKGNLQLELCIFPPFKKIPYHTHEKSDIEILHLWGKASYGRIHNNDSRHYDAGFKDIGRCFSVPAYSLHGAAISWTGLITVSIQRWKNSSDMNSVTQDYHE